MVRLLGLTGPIACGKSSVSEILAKSGEHLGLVGHFGISLGLVFCGGFCLEPQNLGCQVSAFTQVLSLDISLSYFGISLYVGIVTFRKFYLGGMYLSMEMYICIYIYIHTYI